MTASYPTPTLDTTGQYVLLAPNEYRFGEGTLHRVESAEFNEPDIRANDKDRDGGDASLKGRTFFGGRQILFTINSIKRGYGTDVQSEVNKFHAAWNAPLIRWDPSAVAELHWNRNGFKRMVYGEPRNFKSDSKLSRYNWKPVTCDFKTFDHLFYDSEWQTFALSSRLPITGGFLVPFLVPILLSGTPTGAQARISVSGVEPTWPLIYFYGPGSNFTLRIAQYGFITMPITLQHDEYVLIDTRPWSRIVWHSKGYPLSGAFTWESNDIEDFMLWPGDWFPTFEVIDNTGNARVVIQWRPAHADV